MLAIVDAQREYALHDHNGNGVLEYAQRFSSDPGKQNGLYWETAEGETPSPLGPLVTQARREGYTSKHSSDAATSPPYHGYYFRILYGQGKDAAGGAYDYIVQGKMIGGFAVIAVSALYGNSGVMAFLVNHDGVVYEKNLGKNTMTIAQKIKLFNPDKSWRKVETTAMP